jgi:putative hemolysin
MRLQQDAVVQKQGGLRIGFARNWDEVREAQRLRYRVFAEELGARLDTPESGIDHDLYDRHCEHLLVRDGSSNEVVGTYRLLSADRARRIGGFYSDDEFDLTRIGHLRDRILEVGRSCVHPMYRNGATIGLLWSGIMQYLQRNPVHEYVMGCASMAMGDGGHVAASLYRQMERTHMSPIEYRVFPRHPLPLVNLIDSIDASLPPLVKGYLRLGCYVCGEPAWDPDFNTADLLLLLPMSRMEQRYARRYLRAA